MEALRRIAKAAKEFITSLFRNIRESMLSMSLAFQNLIRMSLSKTVMELEETNHKNLSFDYIPNVDFKIASLISIDKRIRKRPMSATNFKKLWSHFHLVMSILAIYASLTGFTIQDIVRFIFSW